MNKSLGNWPMARNVGREQPQNPKPLSAQAGPWSKPFQRPNSRLISFSAGISRKMSAQCLFYKLTPIPTT